MQKEDCVLCEGMILSPFDCKILHILLELSKHVHTPPPTVRDLGGCKTKYSELGAGRSKGFCAAVTPFPRCSGIVVV